MRVCVRVCMRMCVCACVRACVCARTCVHMCVHTLTKNLQICVLIYASYVEIRIYHYPHASYLHLCLFSGEVQAEVIQTKCGRAFK